MKLRSKKKILVLIDWYLPGRKGGGPVKSIESLVWAMKDYFDFDILSTDTDLGESVPYQDIVCDQWLPREDGSRVRYMKSSELSAAYLQDSVNSVVYDVLYLNSYYSKWFSIVPLRLLKKGKIKGPVVLASRGMLSAGAIAIKTLKKKTFIRISSVTGLHKNLRWHATYPEEVNEIQKFYGMDSDIALAANFSKPLGHQRTPAFKKPGELKLFYLSRVSRVKNLHLALESLLKLENRGEVVYDIFGAIENAEYKRECDSFISRLPQNIKVNFKGEISNNTLGEVLPSYHFLYLPTSNENFGHSIFEALQCACPVIISNRTPWRNLEERGCGWDVEPEVNSFIPILGKCLEMDNEAYTQLSRGARELAQEVLQDSKKIEQTLTLFSL